MALLNDLTISPTFDQAKKINKFEENKLENWRKSIREKIP